MTGFRFFAAPAIAALLLIGYSARADDTLTAQVQQEPEPYRHVLAKEIDWLTRKQSDPKHLKSFEPSQITLRVVTPKSQIQQTFPRYRFYAVTFTNRPKQEVSGRFPGRPVTIDDGAYLFIVGPTGKPYKTLDIGAPNDDFVQLLKDNRIALRSAKDVRRMWNLYLDLEDLPNPERFANMPGYEKGRERQRQSPIQQSAPGQWDIEIGFSDLSSKAITQTMPNKPVSLKIAYRIALNADKTIAAIKRINLPIVILH